MNITLDCFTPRFNEACRREGIEGEELFKKTRDQIIAIIRAKDSTDQMLNEKTIESIEKHMENRRIRKV